MSTAPGDSVQGIVDQWAAQCPDLNASPLLVVGRIARLATRYDAILRPPFAAAGLSPGDFDVLAALRRCADPCTLSPSELAESMLVTQGAVTKRVDRLEAQGYVERSCSETDRRGRVIRLTDAGRGLVDRLLPDHLAVAADLIGGMPRTDRDQLGRLLAHLLDAVEDPTVTTRPDRRPPVAS